MKRTLLFGWLSASIALLIVSCGRFEGAFHFLREPPKEEAVPGTYILDQASYSKNMLMSWGYADLSVKIVLRKDKSFEIVQMPDCWLTEHAEPKKGYDSCRGTWSLYKNNSVYSISLGINTWSDGSTFAKERKAPIGGYGYNGAFFLTKEKEGYGLALPIAAGDNGFVYFVRQKNL